MGLESRKLLKSPSSSSNEGAIPAKEALLLLKAKSPLKAKLASLSSNINEGAIPLKQAC